MGSESTDWPHAVFQHSPIPSKLLAFLLVEWLCIDSQDCVRDCGIVEFSQHLFSPRQLGTLPILCGLLFAGLGVDPLLFSALPKRSLLTPYFCFKGEKTKSTGSLGRQRQRKGKEWTRGAERKEMAVLVQLALPCNGAAHGGGGSAAIISQAFLQQFLRGQFFCKKGRTNHFFRNPRFLSIPLLLCLKKGGRSPVSHSSAVQPPNPRVLLSECKSFVCLCTKGLPDQFQS